MFLVTAVVLFPLTANAIEGDVWGTWPGPDTVFISGEIRVPPESTLVIEPGLLVVFQGHYKFIVDTLATLTAVGTETDSVVFTPLFPGIGWGGIRFTHSDSGSCLSYCVLEYGKAIGGGADANGGSVFIDNCSPTISHSTMRQCSAAGWGGAIYCKSSHAVISNNSINGNSAVHGGGIYCEPYSNATISNNTINGNSAEHGGGIYCTRNSNLTITNNTVSWNSAEHGGGIYFFESHPAINNNTLTGNSANVGGGIYCSYSTPRISNNTISRNSADISGGGIYCISSSPTIINSILWADTPQEIAVLSGNPTVTYCDVQRGWSGIGNIDADPIFVGPEREDFYLRWHSPCIDAGDPSLTDPDGTRSDIGALYFNQHVVGIAELYPLNSPIVIPPEGGHISYDAWIFNFTIFNITVDIWSYAFVPGMGQYGPINHYAHINVSPMDSIGVNGKRNRVAGAAPAGDYSFVAYIGDFPNSIIDSSYFYFTKTGSVGGGVTDWFKGEGWFKEANPELSNLPADYVLSQNYPNPFNATTVIEYALPVEGHVKLQVYNIRGQKVATLVDSKQQGGYRSVSWDASKVSSGLYFYRLTAGDFTETRRMMLVK